MGGPEIRIQDPIKSAVRYMVLEDVVSRSLEEVEPSWGQGVHNLFEASHPDKSPPGFGASGVKHRVPYFICCMGALEMNMEHRVPCILPYF